MYIERLVKRKCLDDHISLIREACQVFKRGVKDSVLAFREIRESCRFLSRLIKFVDRDGGDLCLLASHVKNMEQFKPICRMSRQQWNSSEDAEERVNNYVVSRTR